MAIKFCGMLHCSILLLLVSRSASGLDETKDPIKSCPRENSADSSCDTRENSNMDSYIVGGQIADATQYPSYVSIRVKIVNHEEFEDYNGCGGVLVADRWVLTAAHCESYFPAGDPNQGVYGTGEVGVHLDNEGEFSRRIKTQAYFIYPSEDSFLYNHGVDIALLYLAEGATQYGAEIMDLYTGSKPLGREVTLVGLGLTGPDSQAFDPDVRFLRYFDSEVTNDVHCMSIINGGSIYNPQHDLCVGKEGVYQTSGPSDSGGPLYTRNKYTNRMAVAGIVGGSVSTDPDQQEPGNISWEYTRFAMVSYVADWVYKTIDDNE